MDRTVLWFHVCVSPWRSSVSWGSLFGCARPSTPYCDGWPLRHHMYFAAHVHVRWTLSDCAHDVTDSGLSDLSGLGVLCLSHCVRCSLDSALHAVVLSRLDVAQLDCARVCHVLRDGLVT